jgi:hypothetical protein
MIDWRKLFPQPTAPQLTGAEQVLAQAAVSGGVALLTTRRLVVSSASGERSVALSAVGAVEVAFERSIRRIVTGLVLIGIAVLLLGVTGHIAGYLTAQSQSLDSLLRTEGTDTNAVTGISSQAQRGLSAVAVGAAWLPLIAWALLIWGGARIALGVWGTTAVDVFSMVGHYRLERRGHSTPLDELGREMARRFGEARS